MALHPNYSRWLFCLASMLAAAQAQASCGASFCMVNTDWQALGHGIQPGWRAKAQFEFLDQDQLRSGTDTISRAEVQAHHVELRTINRNWLAELAYGIDQDWGVSLSIPYIVRSHGHIHNHHGAELYESWHLNGLGDVRAQARYQFRGGDPDESSAGIGFGLKLPTGEFHERNGDGDEAERSLEPGSGTTDLLLNLYSITPMDAHWGSLYAAISAQLPVRERDGYRPGHRFQADLGWTYPVGAHSNLVLQANLSHKLADEGANAEPEDSGSTFLSVSPGITYALGASTSVYGFLQLPLYQRVKGVQLTYDYALAVGVTSVF